MHDGVKQQVSDVYREMARRCRYRPTAPSDGLGNITVPEDQLDLEKECRTYAEHWCAEEDSHSFWVGGCNFDYRPAAIYAVEAVRCLNGVDLETASKLLKLALKEVESYQRREEGRRSAAP